MSEPGSDGRTYNSHQENNSKCKIGNLSGWERSWKNCRNRKKRYPLRQQR